jgi:hypothetical protein
VQGTCAAGYADCAAGNGCETPLGTIANCASCGNACSNAHGGNSCVGASGGYDCAPTCETGFKSCDDNPDNGCEADLSTAASCGNCGVACQGATPQCVAGACVNARVNSSTGAIYGNAGRLDFSHTLATAAGRGRLVVVAVGSDGNGQAGSAATSASYNGASMTLAKQVWSGERVTASVYYIKDASLPSPGTYTVSINGGDYAKVANVYELRGMDQGTSAEANGGSAGGDCATDGPNDTVGGTTANGFVVSVVAAFGGNQGSPSGNPQTPLEAYTNQAGSLGFKSGYVVNAPSGTKTIGWNMSNCSRTAHAMVTFRPAP